MLSLQRERTGGMRSQAVRVEGERVDGGDAIAEVQARERWVHAESGQRRFFDRRDCASRQRGEIRSAHIEIVLPGELGAWQLPVLEQRSQIEIRRCQLPPRRVFLRISVDEAI